MKKLRVYFKSSLINAYKYFDVETPEEGKRLIEALDATIGSIIKENDLKPAGTYSDGLEEFDNDLTHPEWIEWLHPELGCHIDEVESLDYIKRLTEGNGFSKNLN